MGAIASDGCLAEVCLRVLQLTEPMARWLSRIRCGEGATQSWGTGWFTIWIVRVAGDVRGIVVIQMSDWVTEMRSLQFWAALDRVPLSCLRIG